MTLTILFRIPFCIGNDLSTLFARKKCIYLKFCANKKKKHRNINKMYTNLHQSNVRTLVWSTIAVILTSNVASCYLYIIKGSDAQF